MNNASSKLLTGYGIELRVERGALVMRDGIADRHNEHRLHRADRDVRRITVLSSTGHITLGAMRWCADVGITLTVIDPVDATLLATNVLRDHDDARLRRSQAKALDTDTGLRVAKGLIHAKIAGQLTNVRDILADANATTHLDKYLAQVDAADSADALGLIEANAALQYFTAWAGIPVRFRVQEHDLVPPGWLRYPQRTSPLSSGKTPRGATHPINALLNYAYRLAEIDATLAAHSLGLDPGLGVLHRDKPGRDSLTLDLIEPIRPNIDRDILDLVRTTVFSRNDFVETRDGQCRITQTLAGHLCQLAPRWAEQLAPHAESVAHTLADKATGTGWQRTPLTGRPRNNDPSARPRRSAPQPLPRCPQCGSQLEDRRRSLCKNCADDQRLAIARQRVDDARTRIAAATSLAANERRAAKVSLNRAEGALWDLEHPEEPRDQDYYRLNVLPAAATLTAPLIARRLNIAEDAAYRIRAGTLVPHPRHWAALASAAPVPVSGGMS